MGVIQYVLLAVATAWAENVLPVVRVVRNHSSFQVNLRESASWTCMVHWMGVPSGTVTSPWFWVSTLGRPV